MNLSIKDCRFIIEAIEHQINAYQARLQVIENVEENEDEAADLGNDIKFLELLLADMNRNLDQNNSAKPCRR
jgi:conjugal transfer/entry exclusion protein